MLLLLVRLSLRAEPPWPPSCLVVRILTAPLSLRLWGAPVWGLPSRRCSPRLLRPCLRRRSGLSRLVCRLLVRVPVSLPCAALPAWVDPLALTPLASPARLLPLARRYLASRRRRTIALWRRGSRRPRLPHLAPLVPPLLTPLSLGGPPPSRMLLLLRVPRLSFLVLSPVPGVSLPLPAPPLPIPSQTPLGLL